MKAYLVQQLISRPLQTAQTSCNVSMLLLNSQHSLNCGTCFYSSHPLRTAHNKTLLVPTSTFQLLPQSANFATPSSKNPRRKSLLRPPVQVAQPTNIVNSLINQAWADKVVLKIQEVCDLTSAGTTIYDFTPGNGVITRALLEAGVQNMTSFTYKSTDETRLFKLKKQFKGRQLSLVNTRFTLKYLTSDIQHTSCRSTSHHDNDEQDVPVTGAKVVASVTSNYLKLLLSQMLLMCALQPELALPGRIQIFLTLSALEVMIMKQEAWSSYFTVNRQRLYRLFFHTKVLMEIPLKKNFESTRIINKRNLTHIEGVEVDQDHMYLVKLEVRPDLFQILRPDQMKGFLDFLTEYRMRSSKRLIPGFEQSSPGFGLYLLRRGYRMHDEFKHLREEDLIEIYQALLEKQELNVGLPVSE